MQAFILFRHGKISEEWRDKFYGRLDVPLSEEGIKESIEVVNTLSNLDGLIRVYASPLERALFPARLLAERKGIELIIDPLLVEIDYGSWSGRRREEVMADPLYWERLKNDSVRAPNGESIRDIRERARAFWEKVKRLEPKGINIVFTHGGFLRALFCELLSLPSKHFFSIEVLYLRAMLVLLFEDGNFLLRGVNVLASEVGKIIAHSYW
jgi:broad specificity phosphatase PhoE